MCLIGDNSSFQIIFHILSLHLVNICGGESRETPASYFSSDDAPHTDPSGCVLCLSERNEGFL